MTINQLVNDIKALPVEENLSDTAKLRALIDPIESALTAGISRKQLLNILNSNGFQLSLSGLTTALYRIRK